MSYALPLTLAPMEARLADDLPEEGGPWQYEPKWDGFRCLAFRSGAAVELRAKSGKPLGRFFPEVCAMLQALRTQCFVIDGELIIQQDGSSSFEALQLRLHPAESRIRRLAAETPARLVLFDMLAREDGSVLLDRPLRERRAQLERFVKREHVRDLELSPASRQPAAARRWLRAAGSGNTDGVVAKQLEGPYRPGERAMIKVKPVRTADCVVGGFRYLSRRHEVGSLLLGLYDPQGRLDHVGFTSTISNEDRPAITRRLERLRARPGFTGRAPGGPSRWSTERSGQWEPVRPVMVVEVRFDQVSDERFRHGTRLVRWRPDKAPRQCTLEQLAPAAAGRLRSVPAGTQRREGAARRAGAAASSGDRRPRRSTFPARG